jgi:peptide/nickel transport system substrate-binding protein
LNEKLAVAYGARIDEAINQQRFEFGRRALHDLESISPNHLVVIQSREKFIKRARDLAERAKEKSGPERVDALIDALRVWPALEGTGDEFQAAFAEWPTLDVGVIDIPRGLNPFSKTPAMARAGRLIYRPLVGNSGDSAGVVPTPDQLAESIETADLGRRLEIVLRPGPMWSDGTRPLSSVDVAHALVSWADPRSPGYNARWSDVLERVESSDDTRVAVILRRPLVQAAAWFARPIGPAHAAWDGRVPTRDGKRKPIGTGLFVWISEEKDRMILERNEPASGDSSIPIRRIREVRLPSGPAAVGALVRGEITLLEHVPPDRVASLRERDDIKVGKLQSPSLHVVSLDGRNPALKNRLLRRAIATAIDRKTFLEETLLRRPIDDANRPADGPAIIGASIDAPGVRPYDTGALQAKMLVAGAKPQLGGKPIKLTFEYPALPEAQIAAPWIAENLRAAGMEIDLVERPQSELEARLRAGERFDLAYRVIRTTDPIRDLGPTLCPGYDASPASGGLGALETSPRILQLILQLEQSTDPTEAIALATQVDRECHDELPIIPLWQLEDHFAWRTRLEGPKDGAESLYQGIEQWEVKAWFARDPW